MSDAEPPRPLPNASVEAILAATNRSGSHSPAMIEGLGRWLGDTLEAAVRRARGKPLVKHDVDRLESAYLHFRDTIAELQDRNDPPPCINVSDGSTDWEHWLSGHQHFKFKRGRRDSRDWKLIGAMIALYEIVSESRASAAQAESPTKRFLETALGELRNQVPSDLRSYFAMPNIEALKQQLPRLREFDIPIARKRLEPILGPKAG